MKRIIFFLLALPFALAAQEQPDSTLTTYENRAGVFFSVVRNYYPTGRISTEETPLGSDTAAVANAIIGPVFTANTQIAIYAAQVARINRQRQQVTAASQALQSLVGLDYADVVENIVAQEFLDSLQPTPYVMRVNGVPIDVELRQNNNGRLVLRQGSTNFRIELFSRNWIRIRRYQGSETETPDNTVRLDLFEETPGRWISQDLGYTLRRQ